LEFLRKEEEEEEKEEGSKILKKNLKELRP
jgi:hypothetical protein